MVNTLAQFTLLLYTPFEWFGIKVKLFFYILNEHNTLEVHC